MKVHTKPCKSPAHGSPCGLEHTYECTQCGEEFSVDESSHATVHGVVLPLQYWPVCSLNCYNAAYPDSDPNDILEDIE